MKRKQKRSNPSGTWSGSFDLDAFAWSLMASSLSIQVKGVGFVLAHLVGSKGTYPAVKTIGEKATLSEASTGPYLNQLEHAGFVLRMRRADKGGRRATSAFFLMTPGLAEDFENGWAELTHQTPAPRGLVAPSQTPAGHGLETSAQTPAPRGLVATKGEPNPSLEVFGQTPALQGGSGSDPDPDPDQSLEWVRSGGDPDPEREQIRNELHLSEIEGDDDRDPWAHPLLRDLAADIELCLRFSDDQLTEIGWAVVADLQQHHDRYGEAPSERQVTTIVTSRVDAAYRARPRSAGAGR